MSSQRLPFLDVFISKDGRFGSTGILMVTPYKKDTSIAAPLSSQRMHPRSVHQSWPMSRCKHFKRISSMACDARSAMRDLIVHLLSVDPLHPALQVLRSDLAHIQSPKSTRRKGDGSWLVMPYHYAWSKIVPKIIAEHECLFHGVLSMVLPRISWSKGDLIFCSYISSFCNKQCCKVES